MKRPKTLVAIAVGAYLLGFGMLAGMALDRMRFDVQRTAVLTRYEQADRPAAPHVWVAVGSRSLRRYSRRRT